MTGLPWTVGGILLILAGVGFLSAALSVLKGRRLRERLAPRLGPISEPTRLSIGVVLLIVGYHLVVWGWPGGPGAALHVPARLWYIVLGVAAIWIVGSMFLDAKDREREGGAEGGSGGGV